MSQVATHPPLSQLSYLDATNVEIPVGVLSDLAVVTADGKPVGSIAGVVIEAAARRVRYLDVHSASWFGQRRYLVEADQLAQVDPERKVLRLLSSDVAEVRGLDPATLHHFSDDDLLTVLFSSRAA